MSPTRRTLLGLAAVVLCLWNTAASSAEVRWKKEKFTYAATQGENIREFLRKFGTSQGLMVVVAKEVEGTVHGKFDVLPESMMAMLAANFNFVWYYDGNVLNVTPSSDVRTEVVRLGNTSTERLRQALERLEIPDPRFRITYDARQGTALVSGPSRYIELVMQTARAIGQNQSAGSEVRVISLRYGWAADFTYMQGGVEQTIPGVASVLSRLYGGAPVGRITTTSRPRGTLDKLRGTGLAQNAGDSGRGKSLLPEPEPADMAAGVASADQSLPQFIADGRLNAVLVRDLPERMSAHEAAVRALDIKPGIIEIEARVIEVNSDEAESLGVDWRLRTSRFDVQSGKPNLPTLSWGTAVSELAPSVGPSGPQPISPSPAATLTAVLGDAGRYLLTRVNVLAQDGKANLLSSPKIVTLDNVEAVLENLSTFFVKVQGNLDVDLFNVSAGSTLRVTPLIVTEGEQRLIKLALRIEDGALTGESVDGLPIVRRSSMRSQTLIGDGESLLIAGYSQEADTGGQTGVPGLSSVPVLGWLFKSTERRKVRVQRLFMLTPRIVTP